MKHENLIISLPSGLSFEMIFVEGGEFFMGSDESEKDNERPAHQVEVSSFYLGQYQVTQDLWEAIMGNNPSKFKGQRKPVETVSWNDAKEFIGKLNEQTGEVFRLPSEAEWEYAARGGKYSQGYLYAGSDKLKQVGWYRENSDDDTHDVGLLLANELGLYDMNGNVWELCENQYPGEFGNSVYESSTAVDFSDSGSYCVLRGGSYFNLPIDCNLSVRNIITVDDLGGDIGFRLARLFK